MEPRGNNRDIVLLNGPWRYAPDAPQFDFGEHLGWTLPGFDDGSWPTMDIPACWDLSDPTLFGFEGFVWFRRNFTIDPTTPGPQFLCFDGANYRADIWLNGHYLGGHDGGFTPFRFRLDPDLIGESPNSLVVRVDNRSLPGRIPGIHLSWFNYGGLYRDVFIERLPVVHLDALVLDCRPSGSGKSGPATVTASVAVMNEGDEPFHGSVALSVGGTTESVNVA